MRVLTIARSGLFALAVAAACGGDTVSASVPAGTTGTERMQRAGRQPEAARPVRDGATAARQPAADRGWKRGARGFATYYAGLLDGRTTASGTAFDNDALLAAHPSYPFGTVVRVTNLRNGRSVIVTIVDRGPVRSARASGVIIDLSRAAAEELDFIDAGRTRVRLEIRDSEKKDEDQDAGAGNVTASADARRTAAATAR
jgi:rare lipoprotein A